MLPPVAPYSDTHARVKLEVTEGTSRGVQSARISSRARCSNTLAGLLSRTAF